MERNGLPGTRRSFSNMGNGGGMLGLEMPLLSNSLPRPPTQNPQNLQQNPQLVTIPNPPQLHQPQQSDQQTQLSMRLPNNPFGNQNPNPPPNPKAPITQLGNSDDDEFSGNPNEDNNNKPFDGKRKNISPWQRMKWTDTMVKLLIMAVYYIGDEAAGSELGSEKKKPGNGGGGGGHQLQKKGKWKSVSRAMMEKGFRVSPQQCEDKFNDLNKRYKRVNDILGKGFACKVVEDHSLLDAMDHLSPKTKEEVRKLLNSKHLFFKEMCAYHSTCGNASSSHSAEPNPNPNTHPSTAEAMEGTSHQPHHQHEQQQCLHSFGSSTPSPPSSMVHSNSKQDYFDMDFDHDDSEEDHESHDEEVELQQEEGRARKRARMSEMEGILSSMSEALALQEVKHKLTRIMDDGSKSLWEKKQWVMTQLVKLEEKGVKYECQALEMEKQRLKWMKYSSKKEREMKRIKIENDKNRLENEKMLLLARHKQMELLMLP